MWILAQVLFWLAAGTILYTFGGYPVLISLLARWKRRPVRQAAITPRVTLLIPAYNEAAIIDQKLQNCLALDYPPTQLEIAVVTDGSDDESLSIIARYADQGVRLFHRPQREGKTAAISRAVPLVSGEIVVFTDANAMIEQGALRALVRNFADPSVGGVAGEKRVQGSGEGLYWRYESYLKRCDSALGSVVGAAGELFAVRRTLFEPPPPTALIDDFVISLRLVEAGWRVVYEPEAVAEEPPSPTLAGEWRRRTRIATGGFQSMRWLSGLLKPSAGRVAWQYFSHKVLRWAATPFLMPATYVLNLTLIGTPIYRFLWLVQTAFYVAALAGYALTRYGVRGGPLHAIFYFCFAHAAGLAGFWRFIKHSQPVTWAKAR